MFKNLILVILFSAKLNYSQTYYKISLSSFKEDKLIVVKAGKYNILLSYIDFLKTFQKDGFNESDTVYKEYSIMKSLLNDYFQKDNRVFDFQYIDQKSRSFFQVRLHYFQQSCLEKGQLMIENVETKSKELFIYHYIDIKKEGNRTTSTDGYLMSDKKTFLSKEIKIEEKEG